MPFVSIEGTQIYYAAEPDPPEPGQITLVLIHGAGGSHEVWSHQLESISGTINVIAPDLPGHGLSEGSGEREISRYAEWVQRFTRTLGPVSLILGGHSMGGAVAMELCLRPMRRLAGAVFIGTGARLRVMPDIFRFLEEDRGAFESIIRQYSFSPKTNEAIKDTYFRIRRKTDPLVTIGDFRACDAFDRMNRLGEIRVPVLVMVGADDQMTPLKYAQYINEKLQESRIEVIPDAGHVVMLEQPGEFNRKIEEFIVEVLSNRSA
jgi:pimeloyl-ACP methyl ester carboxylesterase